MTDLARIMRELDDARRRLKETEIDVTKARRRATRTRRLTGLPDGSTVLLPSGHVGKVHKGQLTQVRLPQGAGVWIPPSVERVIRAASDAKRFTGRTDGSR